MAAKKSLSLVNLFKAKTMSIRDFIFGKNCLKFDGTKRREKFQEKKRNLDTHMVAFRCQTLKDGIGRESGVLIS